MKMKPINLRLSDGTRLGKTFRISRVHNQVSRVEVMDDAHVESSHGYRAAGPH
jgi:hypothetical protein